MNSSGFGPPRVGGGEGGARRRRVGRPASLQVIAEEWLLNDVDLPAFQIVGFEGIWGGRPSPPDRALQPPLPRRRDAEELARRQKSCSHVLGQTSAIISANVEMKSM